MIGYKWALAGMLTALIALPAQAQRLLSAELAPV